jgi:transcriptional regulator with XRE-family HTH domain
MEEKNIYLASNIKYLRKKNNITQTKIAEYLGKTDGAISFWENGSREPNAVDLGNLSILFKVPVSDLLLKDLRKEEPSDNIINLYNTYKHLLTEEDKDMIKYIIEKRVKK